MPPVHNVNKVHYNYTLLDDKWRAKAVASSLGLFHDLVASIFAKSWLHKNWRNPSSQTFALILNGKVKSDMNCQKNYLFDGHKGAPTPSNLIQGWLQISKCHSPYLAVC